MRVQWELSILSEISVLSGQASVARRYGSDSVFQLRCGVLFYF